MTIHQLEVTYDVVTPLFCGGAERDTSELRLPSFKGVLRWWWRALAWAAYDGDLLAIQRDENRVFGSANGGQSRVILRTLQASSSALSVPGALLRDEDDRVVGEGARYLGYGAIAAAASATTQTKAGELSRASRAPFHVAIALRCRDLEERPRDLLYDALRALGTLGGLGSRSRKGYGSLVLRSLVVDAAPTWMAPESIADLRDRIAALIPHRAPAPAPYTAMTTATRVVLVPSRRAPLELLDQIGREMMRYRSWGHRGVVLGKASEKNFRDDHDLMKENARARRAHPRRIVFGLPHNYGSRPEDQVTAVDHDRRASPLLIHLHRCGAQSVAVLAFLPAQFLPRDARIKVGHSRVPLDRSPDFWSPIHTFLDRCVRGTPDALEVRR